MKTILTIIVLTLLSVAAFAQDRDIADDLGFPIAVLPGGEGSSFIIYDTDHGERVVLTPHGADELKDDPQGKGLEIMFEHDYFDIENP